MKFQVRIARNRIVREEQTVEVEARDDAEALSRAAVRANRDAWESWAERVEPATPIKIVKRPIGEVA